MPALARAWVAGAVVDQPLADPILLAGKEFPGGVARVRGDGVEHDQAHPMPAPGEIIDTVPGGGLQRVRARQGARKTGGHGVEAEGALRMALARGARAGACGS